MPMDQNTFPSDRSRVITLGHDLDWSRRVCGEIVVWSNAFAAEEAS
ncbi:MAG: hypothetical protein AAGI46_07280 [Planctomycetota bacterium]